MRVLIVRLSSMGDLVQTLPALTDAARAIPGLRFDWVVDEAFAEVPAWHPQVERVIPSALRRWRHDLSGATRGGEVAAFLAQLRARRYDLIVDVQCELKSALMTRLARGPRHGYDASTVHEWGAQFAYHRRTHVPTSQHAIARMRRLLASALDYRYDDTQVDYGVAPARVGAAPFEVPRPYMVFVHSTSWTSKNWRLAYWQELTRTATAAGYFVALPWGSDAERQRSHDIAAGRDRVVVLPELTISQKAAIIARADASVGLDTGLSHIAAMFDVPAVTIYGATDPLLVGVRGRRQRHLASTFECVGCHAVRCSYGAQPPAEPACLVGTTPAGVWAEVQQLLSGGRPGIRVQTG
jgi:heptosyltransferase-1